MSTIEMKSIIKKFPPATIALDNVNFSVKEGEIHCLLGENGAGKTTLMNVLYGLVKADSGDVFVGDKLVKIDSPKDAIELGIGMVHQHFSLVPTNSVAENIALGHPSVSFLFPLKKVKKTIETLSERYGLSVNPDAMIWQLSAGEQQRVEILKVISKNPRILILDEPTTILTPQEIKNLFQALRQMATEGRTIIFITHKLDEVMAVGDRVSVLKQGKLVKTLETVKTNKQRLAGLMIGRAVLFRLKKPGIRPSKVVLEVSEICALNDRGLPALKHVSFYVRENEILGVAGVAGNGQSELIEVLTGLRKAIKGSVIILGKDVSNQSPKNVADAGVAHIPEKRIRIGIVGDLSVADNLILREYRKTPFSKRIFLKKDFIEKHANKLVKEYNIITPSISTPAKLLSGGNIQRLIVARELQGQPKLIVASHPTYGLDVAATEQIRRWLLKQRELGVAVLLISEDLDEIFSISDRIAVIFEGTMMATVDADEANLEDIGMMMAGIRIE
ncbi:MAG: ABC transporter ATP-binding protein [Candidatus Bathyarchaeota archaeon]|nr:ABC transporter ATP-binding protein [Candidatus Bathyarchaeota archaeon]